MTYDTGASAEELLSILIGDKTSTVLVREFGSGLAAVSATQVDLKKVPGIGSEIARKVSAIKCLAIQMQELGDKKDITYINGPEDVFDLLSREMSALDREHFRVILLNTKNKILGVRTVSVGSLNAAVAHPREIFKSAIEMSAQSIVLVHNHPSGLPEPSREDIIITSRLVDAGKILGIELTDHIILAGGNFVSLVEDGHI